LKNNPQILLTSHLQFHDVIVQLHIIDCKTAMWHENELLIGR